jgi:hypothetical protein
MPQVIKTYEAIVYCKVFSMSPESRKAILDWWWLVILAIVVVGLVTSNGYLIMIGLVVMVIAAILTYALRRRWTIMSSQKV